MCPKEVEAMANSVHLIRVGTVCSGLSVRILSEFYSIGRLFHTIGFFIFLFGVLWPVKNFSLILSQVNCKVRQKLQIPEKNYLITHKQNLVCLTCDPS